MEFLTWFAVLVGFAGIGVFYVFRALVDLFLDGWPR